jgi:hypothetical protein
LPLSKNGYGGWQAYQITGISRPNRSIQKMSSDHRSKVQPAMHARQERAGQGYATTVTAGLPDLKGSMRKSTSHLRALVSRPAPSTQLTDVSGNPSESYRWSHMAAVRREWRHQFGHRYVETSETTATELRSIEAQVRRALYP